MYHDSLHHLRFFVVDVDVVSVMLPVQRKEKRGSLEKQSTSFQWKSRDVVLTKEGDLKYSRNFPLSSCIIPNSEMLKVDYVPRTRRFTVLINGSVPSPKVVGVIKSPMVMLRRKSSALVCHFESLHFQAKDAEDAASWVDALSRAIESGINNNNNTRSGDRGSRISSSYVVGGTMPFSPLARLSLKRERGSSADRGAGGGGRRPAIGQARRGR